MTELQRSKKISGCQELGGKWDEQVSTEEFLSSVITLNNTIMEDANHYTFAQTHRMCNTQTLK